MVVRSLPERLDGATPLHFQLRNIVRAGIESLEHPPGTRLPPERTLAEMYGVSRVTVRQALEVLSREGLAGAPRVSRRAARSSARSLEANFAFLGFGPIRESEERYLPKNPDGDKYGDSLGWQPASFDSSGRGTTMP